MLSELLIAGKPYYIKRHPFHPSATIRVTGSILQCNLWAVGGL